MKQKIGWVLVVLSMGLSSMGLLAGSVAAAQNCDRNAVVYCGFGTKQELINKLNNGDGNPYGRSNDLKAIFDSHNISQTDINNAVDGVVTKDGRVLVDGKVVANGAWSVGREFIDGSQADGSLWMRPTTASFVSDNLPALVSLDASGKFRIAILKACGNPVLASPVAVVATTQKIECTTLSSNPSSGTVPLAVVFSVTTLPTSITDAVTYLYDFGDGAMTETTGRTAGHTYTSSGNYTARVRLKTAAGITDYKTICQQTIRVNPKPVAVTATTTVITPPTVTVAPLPVQTPRTGMAGTMGLVGGAGGGMMAYALSQYRRSKRLVIEALKR